MIKNILLIGFFALFSLSVYAKSGINIFAYSRPAPQTPVYTPAEQAISLENFKGEFILVMFWSRTCAPCIRELDDINAFVNKTRNTGIKVMLVSDAGEWKSLSEQRNLLQKYKAPDVDFYTDKNGKLAGDFGVFSYPHTVMVDQSGEEIGRISGSVDWDDDDVIEYIYKLKAKYGQGNDE